MKVSHSRTCPRSYGDASLGEVWGGWAKNFPSNLEDKDPDGQKKWTLYAPLRGHNKHTILDKKATFIWINYISWQAVVICLLVEVKQATQYIRQIWTQGPIWYGQTLFLDQTLERKRPLYFYMGNIISWPALVWSLKSFKLLTL